MKIQSVTKTKPTDPARVAISDVSNNETYDFAALTRLLGQAASAQLGEEQTLMLKPVQQEEQA